TEGVTLQVTRKADAGGEHDVGVVTTGLEPVQPVIRNRRKFFHWMARDPLGRLEGTDLVAKLGGPLEVFRLDRAVEPAPQPLQPLLHRGSARVGREVDLADVLRSTVYPPEQPPERRRERFV